MRVLCSTDPKPFARNRGTPAAWLAASVLTLALAGPAAAEPAADSASADQRLSDCRTTLQVRQALAQDKELKPLNLGVNVRGGTATLFGAVPSSDLAKRAAERTRAVPGVMEVRTELTVESPADPTVQFLNQPVNRRTSPFPELFRSHRHRLPPGLTSRPEETDERPELPAIVVPAPRADEAGNVATRIDFLRAAEERFNGIRVEVNGTTVRLSGSARRMEDVWELAGRVARVPGVERVVVAPPQ